MAGFLDSLFGSPDQTQALGLLGSYMMAGQAPQGFLAANQHLAGAKDRQLKRGLLEAQLDETRAQAEERRRQRAFLENLTDPTFSAGQQALAGGGGPTMGNAARIAPVDPLRQQMFNATKAGLVGLPDYFKAMTPKQDEWSPTPQLMRDPSTGSVVPVLVSKSGQTKVLPFGAKPDIQLQDTGSGFQAVDKNVIGHGFTLPKTGNPFSDMLVGGPNGIVPNAPLIDAKKQVARAGAATFNMDNLGLKPKDRFEMEDKLRADFTKATSTDQNIIGTAADIANILQQTGSLKDQAAIYKFAKALDPDGAVREADYAAIVKTAGGADYLIALANKALTGEQLSPKQRSEMASVTQAMANIAQQRIARQQDIYAQRARMYNLTPENVFAAPQAAAAAPPTSPRAAFTDPAKESRYQEWKRQQGAK